MTEICIRKFAEFRDRENFLMDYVSNCRREKARRFLQADDRLRCLVAGYLLKKHLPGYAEDRLQIGKDGKPFLSGGSAFSISHGGDYVVLAWDEDAAGIGVDVEPIRKIEYYREILPFCTTEEERKEIGEDARKAVWVWTRKESLYKCFGEGISNPLELPATLAERVMFRGASCSLRSWEQDGHIFSIALRNL